jgi:cysteine desulfurase/selenocysteine lyase
MTETITHPVYDLQTIRKQFSITEEGITYLNHAGMTPLAASVQAAMEAAIDAMARYGSGAYERVLMPLSESLRIGLAALVNASPGEIALVPNTSTGLNIIAQSLPFNPGSNVILCDIEFPANVYPWLNLARQKDVETRIIPAQAGGLALQALDAARDGRTQAVAVSAVQFFTGYRAALKELGAYCAEHGIWLIVDAIQAAGIIPLDIKAMGIHAIVAGGQKALCGPPGQGFMAIQADLLERMQPVFVGAVSVEGWEHWLNYDLTLKPGADRFEPGTANIAGIAGLDAAVHMLLDLGVENIGRWVIHLSDLATDDLTARGFDVITPHAPDQHANIVTFAWPGDAQNAVQRLAERGIVMLAHQDSKGNPYLRLSSHCYNTQGEIRTVGEIIEELIE